MNPPQEKWRIVSVGIDEDTLKTIRLFALLSHFIERNGDLYHDITLERPRLTLRQRSDLEDLFWHIDKDNSALRKMLSQNRRSLLHSPKLTDQPLTTKTEALKTMCSLLPRIPELVDEISRMHDDSCEADFI
jgi:UTP:GlnB (protein PII) uridylyltransferase